MESSKSTSTVGAKFRQMVARVQKEICEKVEELEGKHGAKFIHDEITWSLKDGGEGRVSTRVLTNGKIWEKAAVNVTVISPKKPGDIPRVWAIDGAMHPLSPYVPSVHFSYRYIEGTKDWSFGGDTCLIPSIPFDDDKDNFLQFQRKACDSVDKSLHPNFKQGCDDYFLIKNGGGRPGVGVGGIAFRDLHDREPGTLLDLVTACAETVIPSYIPLVKKHKDTHYEPDGPEKNSQKQMRDRYIEFFLHCPGFPNALKLGAAKEIMMTTFPPTAS